MILGNTGIVTVIVTATSSLASATSGASIGIGTGIILAGIALVYVIARFTPISGIWGRFIESRFVESDFFEEGMTEDLLHLSEGFGLIKMFVTEDSPLIGHTLLESNTPESDFWVVGIERGNDWISLPKSLEKIQEDDRLIVYGNIDQLKSIFGTTKDKPSNKD